MAYFRRSATGLRVSPCDAPRRQTLQRPNVAARRFIGASSPGHMNQSMRARANRTEDALELQLRRKFCQWVPRRKQPGSNASLRFARSPILGRKTSMRRSPSEAPGGLTVTDAQRVLTAAAKKRSNYQIRSRCMTDSSASTNKEARKSTGNLKVCLPPRRKPGISGLDESSQLPWFPEEG